MLPSMAALHQIVLRFTGANVFFAERSRKLAEGSRKLAEASTALAEARGRFAEAGGKFCLVLATPSTEGSRKVLPDPFEILGIVAGFLRKLRGSSAEAPRKRYVFWWGKVQGRPTWL